MPGPALWQHSQRGSRRRKWPYTRNVPRQAGLLPRLGHLLGERCRWAPFPRLATERHARRQRRMVHWVRISSPPLSLAAPLFFFFFRAFVYHMQNEFYRASKEEPSQKRHKISKDGYNLGRDWFVERALAGSHWKGHNIWWRAEVEWHAGLLEPGNKGASNPLVPLLVLLVDF